MIARAERIIQFVVLGCSLCRQTQRYHGRSTLYDFIHAPFHSIHKHSIHKQNETNRVDFTKTSYYIFSRSDSSTELYVLCTMYPHVLFVWTQDCWTWHPCTCLSHCLSRFSNGSVLYQVVANQSTSITALYRIYSNGAISKHGRNNTFETVTGHTKAFLEDTSLTFL
jgi:hypothetical protein